MARVDALDKLPSIGLSRESRFRIPTLDARLLRSEAEQMVIIAVIIRVLNVAAAVNRPYAVRTEGYRRRIRDGGVDRRGRQDGRRGESPVPWVDRIRIAARLDVNGDGEADACAQDVYLAIAGNMAAAHDQVKD